ncbi:MAG TPA: single-stranded DNA-binding protein [Mesotoga sp.]|nr:single-stranded DNA-binding protein [Mesotoga sp.]
MNKIILSGNVVNDPELSFTNNGKQMAKFAIANNDARKFDKNAEALFINCVAWDKTAEFMGNYCKKGTAVIIEGSLKINKWQARDGAKKESTVINVTAVEFAPSKSSKQATTDEPLF